MLRWLEETLNSIMKYVAMVVIGLYGWHVINERMEEADGNSCGGKSCREDHREITRDR